MKTIGKFVLLLACVVLASVGRSWAQVPPSIGSGTNQTIQCKQDAEVIKIPPSVICVDFDKTSIFVGKPDIPLTITIESLAERQLELVSIFEPSDDATEKWIEFSRIKPGEVLASGKVVRMTYDCLLSISEKAEPGRVQISLRFKYKDDKLPPPEDVDFRLRVGGNGGIKIADVARTPIEPRTGRIKTINLTMKSAYRNFPVRLNKIIITSNPPELVPETSIPVDIQFRTVKDVETAQVSFKVRRMEWWDWFKGFGKATLNFEFNYTDSDGREAKSLDEIELAVIPSGLVLVSSVLLGVLAGTFFKIDLKRLQNEGYITRKQKAYFILGTVIIGVIAALVALVGELDITVFNLKGSYDSPKVLFLIGLAATVAGPPLLRGVLKPSKPKSADKDGSAESI
jgi:hypothetical protein